jgi:hypothetical protein
MENGGSMGESCNDACPQTQFFVIPSGVEESRRTLRIPPRDPSTPLRFAQDDPPGLRLACRLSSLVDFHYKFAGRIDIASVHSVCIKWQRDFGLSIDCDQAAAATNLSGFVQSRVRCLLQLHPAIFH